MKLYFMRHGIAEYGVGVSDHDRRLTQRGIQRIETAGRVLKMTGINPAHIYSSPRIRAKQTAEIVAQALGMTVELRDEVNFDFDSQAVEALITGLADEAEVMFVGHEPSMSTTLGEITGGVVIMKKGSLARVDLVRRNPVRGILVWLIAPRIFNAMLDSDDIEDEE